MKNKAIIFIWAVCIFSTNAQNEKAGLEQIQENAPKITLKSDVLGTLDSSYYMQYEDNCWDVKTKWQYIYRSSTSMDEIHKYYMSDSGKFAIADIIRYTYDVNRNILEREDIRVWEGETLNKTVYLYDANGNNIRRNRYENQDTAFRLTAIDSIVYEGNKPVYRENKYFLYVDGTYYMTNYYTWDYDMDNLIKYEYGFLNGTTKSPLSKYEYTYQGDKKITSTYIAWNTDSSAWVNSTKDSMVYDGNSLLTETIKFSWSDDAWHVSGLTKHQKNPDNKVTATIGYSTYKSETEFIPNGQTTYNPDYESYFEKTVYQWDYYHWKPTEKHLDFYSKSKISFDASDLCGGKVYTLQLIKNNCTGIENKNTISVWDQILVYPNPSDGTFNITLNNRPEGYYTMNILDLSGKILLTDEFHVTGNLHEYSFSLSDTYSGIYILRISSPEGTYQGKIIVNENR
ncbi:MAG: T9SS type A sorting domain-containing protein [Bacteroidales bacterium]|nr:T9SS type A sorting domain-containing protein [Bacteroidales bacterium]